MACPNWPPPLPSLPLYPPCRPGPPERPPEPKIQLKESQTQLWWTEHLGPYFTRASGNELAKSEPTYEVTRRQRRDFLLMRTQTREDKLMRSVPLPEGSYPRDGLPIWERLYLDRKLPMLKCPPDALVFARQKIGKKLWKDTEGQEFILYDPHSYEVKFSYENVHDPHLTTYYKGKEIRGFLLSLGDATEDGWGLCSLKRFNQYRKYLKRVHLSLVHSEMERQDALKNEILQIKECKRRTDDAMAAMERKTMLEEMRAAIVEALKQERLNRINRLVSNIQAKEDRVRKLYRKRARERERQRQKGLKLLAEQELKNKIAMEIQRRKKIATLRMWHDTEEKTIRILKKMADEKARHKAEKVRIKWQNKIHNLRKMLEKEDDCLRLQEKVRAENIKVRNARMELLKQKEKDRFQEIRREGLRKKGLIRRQRDDKRLEKAITEAWFSINTQDFDSATELYRVKKSINSTMAELLASQMEGPDRLSVILLSRNRIQREQRIPIQVSFAIDAVLETAIQKWAKTRLIHILEAVIAQVKENGRKQLAKIKARYKGMEADFSEPREETQEPKIRKPIRKGSDRKHSSTQRLHSTSNDSEIQDEKLVKQIERTHKTESEKYLLHEDNISQLPVPVIPSYVHFGSVTSHEYPAEYDSEEKLKPIVGRPKTPMPSQEILCQAGFLEEKLHDILPTFVEDVMDLKEKRKFRKLFKSVAIQLFTRSIAETEVAFEPVTRVRAINKLLYLGDTDKGTLTNTLCYLIMNTEEKKMYQTETFDWLSKVVAREVIKEILNPPVLSKEPDDCIARTKIMFYAPKQTFRDLLWEMYRIHTTSFISGYRNAVLKAEVTAVPGKEKSSTLIDLIKLGLNFDEISNVIFHGPKAKNLLKVDVEREKSFL